MSLDQSDSGSGAGPSGPTSVCLASVDPRANDRPITVPCHPVMITITDASPSAAGRRYHRAVSGAPLYYLLGSVGTPVELTIRMGSQATDEWWQAVALALPERWRQSLRRVELVVRHDALYTDPYAGAYSDMLRRIVAQACPECVVDVVTV